VTTRLGLSHALWRTLTSLQIDVFLLSAKIGGSTVDQAEVLTDTFETVSPSVTNLKAPGGTDGCHCSDPLGTYLALHTLLIPVEQVPTVVAAEDVKALLASPFV
jgi:hypothetical protein